MRIHYTRPADLGPDCERLIRFDMDSVRQMIQADRGSDPDVWIVEPTGYVLNGHPLRDSDTIRLIGYVVGSGTLYATDGCNSCRHHVPRPIEALDPSELEATFSGTQLPVDMLIELARQVAATSPTPSERA